MSNIWTELAERQLVATADILGPDATAKQIAEEFAKVTGIPITSDQASSKLRRIREGLPTAPVTPADDRHFLVVPGAGEYVGPRIVFWDIETTDLNGFFGRLLACSFADSWGNVTTYRYTDFDRSNAIDDHLLAVAIRDELERYDIVCGWNSHDFDHRFLDARLLHAGERPLRQDSMRLDLMWHFYKVRAGSRRLDNAAKFFRTADQKTPLSPETWALAGTGDLAALEEVVEHCEADVLTTRAVYARVKPMIPRYTRR